MILKFHNFFDRIFCLFSSFLQQKKLPTSRCGLRKKKRVPSCFFSNQISKYPGYPGINLGIPLPRTNNHKKKIPKKKRKSSSQFPIFTFHGIFFFRTSWDVLAHDSTIGHSCGSVKALPSRSNTWMLFMDRYRLMLYGFCAEKKWYKRYVRCICMCIKQNCLDILENTTLQPAVRVLIV